MAQKQYELLCNGKKLSLSNDGWASVKKEARSTGTGPVLYCVFFKHGVMKIGSTTNIYNRVEALSANGAFNGLFDKLVTVPCGNKNLHQAERKALKALCAATPNIAKEVFFTLPKRRVLHLLRTAILQSDITIEYNFTDEKFYKIAEETNLLGALLVNNFMNRFTESTKEAIEFLLSTITVDAPVSGDLYLTLITTLHPFTAKMVNVLSIKYAELLKYNFQKEECINYLYRFSDVLKQNYKIIT